MEGAIEQAKEDKDVARAYKASQLKALPQREKKKRDATRQAVIPKIREMFYKMDKDGSGDITLAEAPFVSFFSQRSASSSVRCGLKCCVSVLRAASPFPGGRRRRADDLGVDAALAGRNLSRRGAKTA